jgi:asparagine synthase (glutamine-hydrolysing)
MFLERWAWMIDRMGVPLSTPNEVAIHEVASRLRADGCVVTLSGEGADELFAGYEAPLAEAWRFERARDALASPARFQLENNAWIPTSTKGAILDDRLWDAIAHDSWLMAWTEREFDRAAAECGAPTTRLPAGALAVDPVEAHLRHQRRVNLTGLLQRLDTATMLAGVEGRTPFADAHVALVAESLPLARKFTVEEPPTLLAAHTHPTSAPPVLRTRSKLALREAFRADLPAEIVDRPKASFPLPFQGWIAAHADALRTCDFARAIFSPAAIETVAHDPARHWRLAWPMLNLALWGKKWWG